MRRHEIEFVGRASADRGRDAAALLASHGPRLAVVAGLPPSVVRIRDAKRRPVPDPRPLVALIDTGCTRTAIDQGIARSLELPETGVTRIGSATGPAQARLHAVQLVFPTLDGVSVVLPQAAACDLGSQGLGVLIGCDLLRQFVMIYDGLVGRVTLIH